MPSAVSRARSRADRMSSPAVQSSTPATTSNEWKEPAIAEGKPSWEDHGGAPYGVLEDMQTLGQRPSAKVKSRVKDANLRKSLGKNAGAMQDVVTTPEGTPLVDTPRSASVTQDLPPVEPLPIIPDDEKDVDYEPRASKRSTRTRSSRSAAAASETPKAAASTPQTRTKPSQTPSAEPAPRSSPVAAAAPPAREPPPREHKIAGMHKIVMGSVNRSREVGQPDLGDAIYQVYLQSFDDDYITHLLSGILEQNATKKERADFKEYIARARKMNKLRKKSETSAPPAKPSTTKPTSEKPTSRPEAAPRKSIEGPATVPKIKLSVRAPTRTRGTEERQSVTNGQPVNSPKRKGSMSSTSSLSSLGEVAQEGDRIAIDPQRIAPPTANNLKRSSAEADLGADEHDKAVAAKKQKLRELSYQEPAPQIQADESHVREDSTRVLHEKPVANLETPAKATSHRISTRSGRRDMSESPLSDLSPPPASPRGTPRNAANNKMVKKAKTKQSPEKKQLTYSSNSDAMNGRYSSPVDMSEQGHEGDVNDDEADSSDNNDYCNSCGGPGHLLCCDGCDKSFHLRCLDPPLEEDSPELNEPWFCHICAAKRNPPSRQRRGLFAQLLQNLEKRNPSNYTLPEHIRLYFEGVATGKDGQFVEPPTSRTRSRVGYDEPLDLMKTKDGRGNTILCYHCGKSAAGRREIITCDLCGAHWHLDCTDPPLANPPFRDQYNRKVRDWLCPLHVDHDLREMDPSRIVRPRTFHNRRPKNPKIIDTALRRGQVNHGIIEVIEDSSSEDDSEFEDEEVASGTVYRLPAKGIKLDFIDKVTSGRKAKEQARNIAEAQLDLVQIPIVRRKIFTSRPFEEKKTALSLVQFARQGSNGDLGLNGEKIDDLVGTLIAEAPDAVTKQLSTNETDAKAAIQLTPEQRNDLLVLQELIRRRLEGVNGADA